MMTRGVRGATTAQDNTSDEILKATRELLALMIRRNKIKSEDVASVTFTTTTDLTAEFPALAARQLNWMNVPLLCGHEMQVPGDLPRCIRIMVLWNTEKLQDEIQHVYMRDALRLRPDLCNLPPINWKELEAWIDEHLNEDIKSTRS